MRIIWDKLILCLPMRNIEMEEEDIHIYIYRTMCLFLEIS